MWRRGWVRYLIRLDRLFYLGEFATRHSFVARVVPDSWFAVSCAVY